MIGAIIKAILAAFNVFKQERSIYNKPEMVKNKVDLAVQQSRDAIRQAEAVLANPNSTKEEHANALRTIRLAGS